MTQEEKSKAYDKVREKIKVRFGTNVAEEIFSEFEETEDERISKEIIKYLEQTVPHHHRDEVLKSKEWTAWLKKQGEQKSAWSEEDEKMLEDIMSFINHESVIEGLKCRGVDYSLSTSARIMENSINWLKSLKTRCTWKPSDEQIQAVRLVRVFVTDDFGENPTLSDILLELEEQLKKVKGE